ncbi:hypothetical protein B0H13DRAFT_1891761 [Mycena leptocephala]|nr:hypothetical protein B0H13DRAFT_1891761 [Mycena leptocephala]
MCERINETQTPLDGRRAYEEGGAKVDAEEQVTSNGLHGFKVDCVHTQVRPRRSESLDAIRSVTEVEMKDERMCEYMFCHESRYNLTVRTKSRVDESMESETLLVGERGSENFPASECSQPKSRRNRIAHCAQRQQVWMRWKRARKLNRVGLKDGIEQEVKDGQKQGTRSGGCAVVKRDTGKWVGSGNGFARVGFADATSIVGSLCRRQHRNRRGGWNSEKKVRGKQKRGSIEKR